MDISIIILNYKSKGFVLNCVKSIKEADWNGLKYEIIVVDNNSKDGLGEILDWQNPEVKFIRNDKNIGMGAGNNLGIGKSQGKYIVIMNPDTIAFQDTFKKMYELMEFDNSIGLAGPKQYYPDKTVQDSCFRWYSLLTPFYRRTFLGSTKFSKKDLDRILMRDYNKKNGREVDWLLGSFLFCRRTLLDKIGLFDERFFMYFEDADLCRRCWDSGSRVYYYPEAEIIHNHLRQSAQEPWYKFFLNKISLIHIISWFKYLKKWGLNNHKIKYNNYEKNN